EPADALAVQVRVARDVVQVPGLAPGEHPRREGRVARGVEEGRGDGAAETEVARAQEPRARVVEQPYRAHVELELLAGRVEHGARQRAAVGVRRARGGGPPPQLQRPPAARG